MTKPPLGADMRTSRLIVARIEGAIERETRTAQFAHAELDPRVVEYEAAWASIRWGHRTLEQVGQIVEPREPPRLVPLPEDSEPEILPWPAATPTPEHDE